MLVLELMSPLFSPEKMIVPDITEDQLNRFKAYMSLKAKMPDTKARPGPSPQEVNAKIRKVGHYKVKNLTKY